MRTKELAYVAGIFDGEGHVGIRKRLPSGVNKTPTYSLVASVSMTDPIIPSMLYKAFGGTLIRERKSAQRPTWKDLWQWKVTANLAVKFLRAILPHLLVKKNQAELGLEFHRTKWSGLHRGRTHCSPSQEELASRERYYREMKRLKHVKIGTAAKTSDRPQWMKASCPTCFKQFIPHERPKRGAIHIYCSVPCRRKAFNRRRVEARAALRRSIQRMCALCSKPFELPRGSNRSGTRAAKWCSVACRQKGTRLRKEAYRERVNKEREQPRLF